MNIKPVIASLLAIALSAEFITPCVGSADTMQPVKGDLNADGHFTESDLVLLQDHLMDKAVLSKELSEKADMNGDGKVNSFDLVLLRQAVEKNINAPTQPATTAPVTTAPVTTTTAKATTVTTTQTTAPATTTAAPVTTAKPKYDLYTTYNVTTYLNIRTETNTNSPVLGTIPASAEFKVTSINGSWAYAEYNGVIGWVNTAYITKKDTPVEPADDIYTTYKVTIYMNIRKEPNVGAAVLGTIPAYADFKVLENDNLWAKAEYNGVTGWVNAAYIIKKGTTNSAYKYPYAAATLDKVGWDLKTAFTQAASIKYYGHTDDMPQDDKTTMEWYANYGFKNGKGNCYVMAAMFCEMARAIGYECHQISGRVPLSAGGFGPHSWTEVVIDGTTYVCDPDFTNETGRNGYMITYGQSGTWRYIKDTTMN